MGILVTGDNRNDKNKKNNEKPSAIRILIFFIVAIFIVEFSIMLLFHFIAPPLPELVISLLDSLLLIIILFPIMYFVIHRPMLLEINERKRTEKALKSSKEFIETVLDSMNDAISVVDIHDYTIIDVNKVFLKTYGLNREDVIGKTCYEITHKRKEPCVPPDDICPLIATLETGNYSTVEHVHYTANGEKRYVEVATSPIKDETGKITRVVHVASDITERKRAELEYKTILRTAIDGFYVADVRGRIMDVNDSYCSMIGYSRDELLNMSIKDIEVIENEAMIARHIKRIIEVGWDRFETSHRRKDGRVIEIEASVNYMDIGGGKFFVFMRDLTEKKIAEKMRLENERLALANRAKSEFLSVMSHELRTPMNSIIGFSELLKQKIAGELNEKQEHFVDNILKSGKRQFSLIEDILDLTLIESNKLELDIEKMPVPETMGEILGMIKPSAASRNVLVKKDLDLELGFIMADRKRFRQIFSNLLDNAVKFSKPEGGTVTVTSKKEGGMAKFSVSDTGIGIKEEDMGKLFMIFQQVDMGTTRKYGGTGIGLAITKQLVELHGGTIMAESKYGEGSTFTFSIPLEIKKGGK